MDQGGSIYAYSSFKSYMLISKSFASYNLADKGGFMYAKIEVLEILNSEFRSNKAE